MATVLLYRCHAPAGSKQHRVYAVALIITQAEVCPLAQSTPYALALWKLSDSPRRSSFVVTSQRPWIKLRATTS